MSNKKKVPMEQLTKDAIKARSSELTYGQLQAQKTIERIRTARKIEKDAKENEKKTKKEKG